jgi:hypothetical protein
LLKLITIYIFIKVKHDCIKLIDKKRSSNS